MECKQSIETGSLDYLLGTGAQGIVAVIPLYHSVCAGDESRNLKDRDLGARGRSLEHFVLQRNPDVYTSCIYIGGVKHGDGAGVPVG